MKMEATYAALAVLVLLLPRRSTARARLPLIANDLHVLLRSRLCLLVGVRVRRGGRTTGHLALSFKQAPQEQRHRTHIVVDDRRRGFAISGHIFPWSFRWTSLLVRGVTGGGVVALLPRDVFATFDASQVFEKAHHGRGVEVHLFDLMRRGLQLRVVASHASCQVG